ncbi:alpha/beta hydrolase [Mesorhizobium sp. SB112]|uniref:alpha/beta hydrolase n=1 Tax=Mesorhizobium sp. SB112 TaxID=3151853 RepID=UPI00326343AE
MDADRYIHTVHKGADEGPLLFVFHGTGGDEHQLVALGRELLPQATIVSPRGDVSEQGSARFFRRTGEGVYDLDDLARATQSMSAFIGAQRAKFSHTPVYGLGYSNGANILASVLFAHPGLFDAAVLMHPLIPFEPNIEGDLEGLKVLITAGRRDPICPPNLTMRLDGYLRTKSADVTLEWHEGGHEIRPNEIETAAKFLRANL